MSMTTLRNLIMTLIQKPLNILVTQTTAGLRTETNDTAVVDSDASTNRVKMTDLTNLAQIQQGLSLIHI